MRLPTYSIRHVLLGTTAIWLAGVTATLARDGTSADRPVHDKLTLAHIRLHGTYPESPQPTLVWSPRVERLDEVVSRIDKAARDPSIVGLFIEVDHPLIGWGKVHELRTALERYRRSGKKVYAYLEMGFLTDYLLATAADEIVMPPSGSLLMTGLRFDVTFYKGLLDKLGIQADLIQIGQYKGSAEPFTRTTMSPQRREQLQALLDDFWDQLLSQIAGRRGLGTDRVASIVDEGPFTAERAKEQGLIDAAAYRDEYIEQLRSRLQTRELVLEKDYGQTQAGADFTGLAGMIKLMNLMLGIEPARQPTTAPKIVIVHVEGVIVPGEGVPGLFGTSVAAADAIVEAIRAADEDPQVSAVVLRVDSPGGSALASDLIWREVVRTKKPLVASMSDTAASGGYYVSMGADVIFAEPGTLTGSIGIIGGKIALRGMYEKLGIVTESLHHGQNSGLLSLDEPFSPSEREAILRLMNDSYEQFVHKAAQGRKKDPVSLEKLASGRVYTGRMAVKHGLVDKLGTLHDAVAEAKTMAGLRPEDAVELEHRPRPKSLLEQLSGLDAAGAMPDVGLPLSMILAEAGFEPEQAQRQISALRTGVRGSGLAAQMLSHWQRLQALALLAHEPVLAFMPLHVQLR